MGEISETETYQWCESMGRAELTLPGEAILNVCQQGANDASVEYWSERLARPSSLTPETLSACLREVGAWDVTELADDAQNWRRMVWIACWDVYEEN